MTRFLSLFFITLLFSTPLMAQEEGAEMAASETEAETTGGLTADDLAVWLEGFMTASLKQGDIAGAVVSVVKDGEILLSEGYGYADVEAEKPMNPDTTMVRAGSTSKLFTWTAVMQLVEEGRLDLDADVSQYLDYELPPFEGKPITMNDLMNHRGGFEEGLKNVLMSDPELFISNEDYLKNHKRPRIFEAGSAPAYSNYGTSLAGYIVEQITGETFDDYVERRILRPLGMNYSTFRQPLPAEFEEHISKGYMAGSGGAKEFELVITAPAGSLSTSATDMGNFMITFLQDGQFGDEVILKPETKELMFTPSYELPEGFSRMSHGFFDGSANGRKVNGHGGDTIYFHTTMNLLPEENVGIFINFNSRGANSSVYGVRSRLFAEFMDRYFPAPESDGEEPAAIADAAAHAQALAGNYETSRRIQSGFLSFFYLFQQSTVTANSDGTIRMGSKKYREISPNIWKEEGGDQKLYAHEVNGVMTLVNSNNPTSVQQKVGAGKTSGFNTSILIGSVGILALTFIFWPINWWHQRQYPAGSGLSGQLLLGHRLSRAAVLVVFLYFLGWYMALAPMLQTQYDAYNNSMDGFIRMLQVSGLLLFVGAGIGLWNAWLTFKSDRGIMVKLGTSLLGLSLLGILWISYAGGLLTFSLEY